MNRTNSKNLILFCLIFLSFLNFSCQSKTVENGDDTGFFDFSSDTEKAVALIKEANGEMLRIKILYNENQNALKELKEATKNGDSERAKIISKNLVDVINDGFVFADSARSKIIAAQELNIEQDYKDYLALKEMSLEKQIEAFQFLYDAARLLSENSGARDKEQIEKSRLVFKEKEENFQAKMDEAKKISSQADDLAKESMKNAK